MRVKMISQELVDLLEKIEVDIGMMEIGVEGAFHVLGEVHTENNVASGLFNIFHILKTDLNHLFIKTNII